MLSFQQSFWCLLPSNSRDADVSDVIQLLPVILIVAQIVVSLGRALRKISFSGYGLSFHSRYAANISFLTNAVGVIGKGYNKV
jgi:ent-kaurene oxidase